MAIADKLTYLGATKTLLREAINDAGGSLTADTPFRQYADWIREQSATLSLDFVREQYITRNVASMFPAAVGAGIITFTRSTGGGIFNAQGQYEWLPANTPRIDYDPVTGEAKGLLVEESRTNLLTYSEQFDNAAWAKNSSSISADSALAPDGTMTADKLVMAVGADPSSPNNIGIMNLNRVDSGTSVSSLSFFAKAGEVSSLRVRENISTGAFLTVDLITGAITGGNTTQFGSPRAVNCGNGWWRISFTTAVGSTSSNRFGLRSNAVGDGTSGIYIWGAQLEAGAFPTSYIPTTTAQVTRAADIAIVNESSPWANQSEGTFYAEFVRAGGLSSSRIVSSTNGMSVPCFVGLAGGANPAPASMYDGIAVKTVNTVSNGALAKVAGAYTVTEKTIILNGGSPVSGARATEYSLTPFDGIGLGAKQSANTFTGHIRSIRYFPRRLSDSELQAITS